MFYKNKMIFLIVLSFIISYFFAFTTVNKDITIYDNILNNIYIKNDNIYFIEHPSILTVINKKGKVLHETKLLSSIVDTYYEYRNLFVDASGDIFITRYEYVDNIIVGNAIEKYDSKLNLLYIHEVNDFDIVMHQYLGDEHILFLRDVGTNKLIIKKGSIDNINSMVSNVFHFDIDISTYKFLYTEVGIAYYIDENYNLFKLFEEGSDLYNQKIQFENDERYVFHRPTVGKNGDVYFYDPARLEYYVFEYEKNEVNLIGLKNIDFVGQNGVNSFSFIRQSDGAVIFIVNKLNVETNSEEIIIYTYENGELYEVPQKYFSIKSLSIKMLTYLIPVFLVCLAIFYILYVFLTTRRIIVRLLLIFIPTFSLGTIFFVKYVGDIFEQELYEQSSLILYSLNSDLVNSLEDIDLSKFQDLKLPLTLDDPVYSEFENLIDLNFDTFYEYTPDALKKNFCYYILYVKDDKRYILYEESINGGIRYVGIEQATYFTDSVIEPFDFQNLTSSKDVVYKKIISFFDEYIYCSSYVKDDLDENILQVAVSVDLNAYNIEFMHFIIETSLRLSFFAIIIISVVVFLLKRNMKGINVLNEAVVEMSEGNWDVTVNVNTKDEIEQIGNAFNKMARKMKIYFKTVENLKYSFERFVPKEMVQIMKKDSILKIQKGDFITDEMVIVSIKTRDFYDITKNMSDEESFDFLNTIFNMLSKPIKKYKGYVENFYSGQIRALFHAGDFSYLTCLLKINERLESCDNNDLRFNIVVQQSNLMFGIVGTEHNLSYSMVSNSLVDTENLNNLAYINEIAVLVTGLTYEVVKNNTRHEFRYVGKIESSLNVLEVIELYDFIEAYPFEEREIKKITKHIFEQGVLNYIDGDFNKARNFFIDVIAIDRFDKLAQSYIFLCDKFIFSRPQNWKGYFEI